MLTLQSLKNRAIVALYNQAEITDELCLKAIKDTDEIAKHRQVAQFYLEDFAYIRLKIYLKIELSSEDEFLLKEATKAIKNAAFIGEDGELKSAIFRKVASREELL